MSLGDRALLFFFGEREKGKGRCEKMGCIK